MSGPPINQILAPIHRKQYVNKQAANLAVNKAKYIGNMAKQKTKDYNKIKEDLESSRKSLIKKGLDYKTIGQVLKTKGRSDVKIVSEIHKKTYPLVITLKTLSIKLK